MKIKKIKVKINEKIKMVLHYTDQRVFWNPETEKLFLKQFSEMSEEGRKQINLLRKRTDEMKQQMKEIRSSLPDCKSVPAQVQSTALMVITGLPAQSFVNTDGYPDCVRLSI